MRNNNKQWHRHYGVYGVCVNKRKELLVIEKNGGPYSGLWDLPGGSFENPESISECLIREIEEETGLCVSISENLSTFDILTNSPYNGFDYTHHIAMTYCIDIISDSEKEISEYVNDRSGSVENDSLGYKWISIDSFCEKNASSLVIKVCELINNKKSFEIIEYVI